MSQARYLIVGGGNMASAIVAGALRAGWSPDRFLVADPDGPKRIAFEAMGVRAAATAAELVGGLRPADQVVLAVKPQMLEAVAAGLGGLGEGRVVISILAGALSARVRTAMGGSVRVVRIMPNTPVRIGLGCSALAIGAGAAPPDGEPARELFSALGLVFDLPEDRFDAFTALAGSGPAYVFLLTEAMTAAAVHAGLPPEVADRAARQTVLGAARLAADAPQSPAQLRAAVTSKGGTTAAAIESLQSAGFEAMFRAALVAARDRGRDLSA